MSTMNVLVILPEARDHEVNSPAYGKLRYQKAADARRRRRLDRETKVFKGRVVPGFQHGADEDTRRKADAAYRRIQKRSASWNKRGAKKGAGGNIRHDDEYMRKLIKMYGGPTVRKQRKLGEGIPVLVFPYFMESRAKRLLGVHRLMRKKAAEYQKTQDARQTKRGSRSGHEAKGTALRAAAVLSRWLTKGKSKTRRGSQRHSDKKLAQLIQKHKLSPEESAES